MNLEKKLYILKKAIDEKKLVEALVYIESRKQEELRKLVPLDYEPSNLNGREEEGRFSFYTNDRDNNHPFKTKQENVINIKVLDEPFNPVDYYKEEGKEWSIERDWNK